MKSWDEEVRPKRYPGHPNRELRTGIDRRSGRQANPVIVETMELLDAYDEEDRRYEAAIKAKKAKMDVVFRAQGALSITRPFNKDAAEAPAVIRFIEDVRLRNPGGEVPKIGALAVELASPFALFTMLSEKFPDAFGERARAKQVQRGFADEFNAYVREQGHLWSEADFVFGATAGQDHDIDDAGLSMAMRTARGWEDGTYVVQPDFAVYNNSYWGLDLTMNEGLHNDFQFVRGYLKQQRLDIGCLEKGPRGKVNFDPHIRFFTPEGSSGNVADIAMDSVVEPPNYVPLYPPAARLVN